MNLITRCNAVQKSSIPFCVIQCDVFVFKLVLYYINSYKQSLVWNHLVDGNFTLDVSMLICFWCLYICWINIMSRVAQNWDDLTWKSPTHIKIYAIHHCMKITVVQVPYKLYWKSQNTSTAYWTMNNWNRVRNRRIKTFS